MKLKLTALLLTLAMTLSLAACGSNDAPAASAPAASQTEESVSSAVTSEEEAPEETPAEEEEPAVEETPEEEKETPAEKPVEQKPAEKPAEKPVEQKPAQPAPQPAPSQPSGGSSADSGSSSAQQSVDLTAFYESQATAFGENFPAMMPMEGEALDAFYAGLTALSPKQTLVCMPMISAVAAEFALVEVSSAEQVEQVKAIFQSRVDYQVEQGAFYPATAEAWENNVRIVSNGNYVMLVCFDQCDTVVGNFNALF